MTTNEKTQNLKELVRQAEAQGVIDEAQALKDAPAPSDGVSPEEMFLELLLARKGTLPAGMREFLTDMGQKVIWLDAIMTEVWEESNAVAEENDRLRAELLVMREKIKGARALGYTEGAMGVVNESDASVAKFGITQVTSRNAYAYLVRFIRSIKSEGAAIDLLRELAHRSWQQAYSNGVGLMGRHIDKVVKEGLELDSLDAQMIARQNWEDFHKWVCSEALKIQRVHAKPRN